MVIFGHKSWIHSQIITQFLSNVRVKIEENDKVIINNHCSTSLWNNFGHESIINTLIMTNVITFYWSASLWHHNDPYLTLGDSEDTTCPCSSARWRRGGDSSFKCWLTLVFNCAFEHFLLLPSNRHTHLLLLSAFQLMSRCFLQPPNTAGLPTHAKCHTSSHNSFGATFMLVISFYFSPSYLRLICCSCDVFFFFA